MRTHPACSVVAVKQPFTDEAWDVEWAQLPTQQHQLALVPWGTPQREHQQQFFEQQYRTRLHKNQRQQQQQQLLQQQRRPQQPPTHERKPQGRMVESQVGVDPCQVHQSSTSSAASPEKVEFSGELPSIGSSGHATGECKRCAFFPKGRCLNGADCGHCHFPHEERRRRRNRRQAPQVGLNLVSNDAETPGFAEVPENPVDVDLTGTPVTLPAHVTSDAAIAFGEFTPQMPREDPLCGICTTSQNMVTEEHGNDSSDDASTCSDPIASVAFASLMHRPDMNGSASSSYQKVEACEDEEEECLEEQLSAEEKYIRSLEEEAEAAEAEAVRLENEALAALAALEKVPAQSVATQVSDNLERCSKKCSSSDSDCGNTSDPTAAGDSSAALISSECDTASDSDTSTSDVQAVEVSHPEEMISEERVAKRHERRQAHKLSGESRVPQGSERVRSPLWQSVAPVSAKKPSAASTTSWAAKAKERREKQQDAGSEDLVRKARGILNKLTPARFETLYEQLIACEIRTSTQLQVIVAEIFEKATIQHCFLPMYVDLCVRLDSHFRAHPVEGADFRKVLVGECQQTFERNLQAPTFDSTLDPEERYEAEVKFKTRMLGNLRFVGELLVKKLLAGKVLLAVSEELLAIGNSEGIEAAAVLLTVAGPSFDRSSWTFVPRLHAIFALLRPLSQDPVIPARVRCILKDLLDLRKRGWTSKK